MQIITVYSAWRSLLLSIFSLGILACEDQNQPDHGELGDDNLVPIIEEIRLQHNIPALGVAVVDNQGLIEQGVSGYRDISKNTPVTLDDSWQLGSVSKAITATLAARLVELGYIAWDSTLSETFPGWAQTMHSAYQSITLTDLLQHRSGLLRDLEANDLELQQQNRQAYVQRGLKIAPEHPQLAEYHYSNFGYVVAGQMLSEVAGESYENLLDMYVFQPLAITDFGFGAPRKHNDDSQPVGHIRRELSNGQRVSPYWLPVGPPDRNEALWTLVAPAGGIYLPLYEYSQYLSMHLAGASGNSDFLSSESFEQLYHAPTGSKYAMGWFTDADLSGIGVEKDEFLLTHGGSIASWLALKVAIPDKNRAFIIVTNSGSTISAKAMYELLEVMLKRHGVIAI